MTITSLIWTVVKIAVMVGFVFNIAGLLTWYDRRGGAMMQDRIGPNRAALKIFGKFELRLAGLLHTAADGVKFFTKEDFMPPKADKLLFSLAPMLAMIPVLVARSRSSRSATRSAPICSGRRVLQGRQRPAMLPVNGVCQAGYVDVRRSSRPRSASGSACARSRSTSGRVAQRRHPLRLRDGGAGHRRRRDRRLVERQQVLAPRRAPRREPDGQLRGHDGPHARRRDHDLRLGPPRRHGRAGRARTRGASSSSRSRSSCSSRPPSPRRKRIPFDLPEARERARRRLLHRVLGHEVRHVLLRRVHRGRRRARCSSSRIFLGG